jgi:Amt family ammonium transporter
LAIGLWGVPALTETAGGLFMGGGFDLLISQIIGVVGVAAWAGVTGGVMFFALNALGILRMPTAAEAVGIDAYEHNASVWPDILPIEETAHAGEGTPAMGD